jgi:hypothetical protein
LDYTRNKTIGISFITTIVVAISITTIFGYNGSNKKLEWWQSFSTQQSKAMDRAVENNCGNQLNRSAVDQDIKITIQSVVADDINTIIQYTIEDLNRKIKYVPVYSEGITVQGDFGLEEIDDPLRGSMNLYTKEENIQKGILKLMPIKEDTSTIYLKIDELESMKKEDNSNIKGIWSFEIPVTKYQSHKYQLNQEIDIDGNKITFDEITIAPTTTILRYTYMNDETKDYTMNGFSDIRIISNRKEYTQDPFGGGWSTYKWGGNGSIVFNTIYFDFPKKICIKIKGYGVTVKKSMEFPIDTDSSFPQCFQYMNHNIKIENIEKQKDCTKVKVIDSFQNQKVQYLQLNFETKDDPHLSRGSSCDGYIIDKNEKKIALEEYYFTYRSKEKVKEGVITYDVKLESIEGEAVMPEILTIEEYDEVRSTYKNVTIRLK